MQAIQQKETDQRLRNAVMQQLEWEPEITSKDINVSAREGVVTLTGFVHSYAEKYTAERVAKKVYGTLGLANDIVVKVGAERSDPEIAHAAVEALVINISVPDKQIKVTVRDAFVTLEGAVDWNFQRESAEASIRTIAGIRGVNNQILIRPVASPIQVKAKIEEALQRSAEVDARRVSVTTEHGTVHLHGNVRSWAEMDEAKQAAWSAPGVTNVVSHLHIVP